MLTYAARSKVINILQPNLREISLEEENMTIMAFPSNTESKEFQVCLFAPFIFVVDHTHLFA